MSEHKKSTPANGIVTSDASYRPHGRLRWLWMIAGGVVLIVVVAAGAYALYRHYSKPVTSPPSATNNTAATGGAQTIQQQMDAAIASAQKELASAKTPAEKATAYSDLGMAYFNSTQYGQSITAYNNAIQADSSVKPQVLNTLAYVYATAGQRDKAIATYQELITLLQQQSDTQHTARLYQGTDTNAAAIQTYQHDIQVLQQGGTIQ